MGFPSYYFSNSLYDFEQTLFSVFQFNHSLIQAGSQWGAS